MFNVQCAGGSKEALKLINTHNFDVVLSDLRMPGLDGLHLLEEMFLLFCCLPTELSKMLWRRHKEVCLDF